MEEIILKLYSPLSADFFPDEAFRDPEIMYRYQYCPDKLTGTELVKHKRAIRKMVHFCNYYHGWDGNLMQYFNEQSNPSVKDKVVSAVPSVVIHNGELMGCTTVHLKEPITASEMADLQNFLKGQYSDGWGENLRQQQIGISGGMLAVHFYEAETFLFIVEQTVPTMKQEDVLKPPKMNLVGQDGNIFAILGRASQLLRGNGQADQAKEMMERVRESGNYDKALNIISEYVETELSTPLKKRKEKKEKGDTR